MWFAGRFQRQLVIPVDCPLASAAVNAMRAQGLIDDLSIRSWSVIPSGHGFLMDEHGQVSILDFREDGVIQATWFRGRV